MAHGNQAHDPTNSDEPSTATQREFYVDVVESLIKSFPGPRDEAIGKAIAYLQHVDSRRLLDSNIGHESRDTFSPTLSSPVEQQYDQVVVNEKNRFGRGSAELDLAQSNKPYS